MFFLQETNSVIAARTVKSPPLIRSFVDLNNTVYLTKAYQLLRNYTRVKVYRTIQKNGSVAEDILDYAQKVDADLIVVNSGKESLLGGLFNRWIEKYLPVKSNIPVLTISSVP